MENTALLPQYNLLAMRTFLAQILMTTVAIPTDANALKYIIIAYFPTHSYSLYVL